MSRLQALPASTKHTPAPWFPGVTLGTSRHCIIGDGDSVICTASSDGLAISNADTALICAAPDLLEALRNLELAVCDIRGIEMDDYCPRELEAARAAIAKATGGAA